MRKLIVGLVSIGMATSVWANLLLNPGFESGTGENAENWWRYENAGRQDWNPRSGTYSMVWYGWSQWYGGFGQDVSRNINAGDVVTFTIWGNAETGFVAQSESSPEAWIKLEFWSGGSMAYQVTQSVYQALKANPNNWVQFTLTVTNTASGITMVKPVVGYGNVVGYNSAAVYWDDATLTVIPEPAAVGLVGVGALWLSLLWRNKRAA